MKETRVKEENFICIQGWMISKLNLKGNDLLVYAIIYGYSQDGSSWFSGGLQYLADWVNSTKRGVLKNLKKLESMGLIEKKSSKNNGIADVKYRYVPEILLGSGQSDVKSKKSDNGMEQNLLGHGAECAGGSEQSSPGYGTEFTGGGEQSSPNNINIINQKQNTKDTSQGRGEKSEEQDKPKRSELIKAIAKQWNCLEDYGIRPVRKLNPDSIRYGRLNARINDYGFESIIQAIESIKKSPFLQGDNDRGWMIYFDWFVKPNNFCKVLEGNYIAQKGAKDNDGSRGYSGKYNSADSGQTVKKYDPSDFLGDGWKD